MTLKNKIKLILGLCVSLVFIPSCTKDVSVSVVNKLYTLSFDTNGAINGNIVPSIDYAPNTLVTLPSQSSVSFSKPNSIFLGWATSDTAIKPLEVFNMPSRDTTLYAVYSASYTLTFDKNGAETGTVPSLIKGGTEIVQLSTAPSLVRSGYTFLGWNTSSTATVPLSIAYTMPFAHTTLYAIWAKNYTLSFNTNGGTGTLPQNQTAYVGQIVTLPTVGTLVNGSNVFYGWSTNATSTTALTSFVMPNQDTVLYAIWGSIESGYPVSFDLNQGFGTVPSTVFYVNEATVVLPQQNNIYRNGYLFLGWGISSADTSAISSYSQQPNATLLYAIWKQRSNVDTDGDGLIEIANATELNNIRFNVSGTNYKISAADAGSNTGCPTSANKIWTRNNSSGVFTSTSPSAGDIGTGNNQYTERTACYGYEIIQDIDISNSVWGSNCSSSCIDGGWLPIGSSDSPLSTVINGNNHVINNLFINRTGSSVDQGFIAYATNATIQNLGFSNVQITAGTNATNSYIAIISNANNTKIRNVFVDNASIIGSTSSNYIATLVANANTNTNISNSYVSDSNVSAYSGNYVGGLVARLVSGSSVNDSYVYNVNIHGATNVGAFIGAVEAGSVNRIYAHSTIVSGSSMVSASVGHIDANSTMANIYIISTSNSPYISTSTTATITGTNYYIASSATGSISCANCTAVTGAIFVDRFMLLQKGSASLVVPYVNWSSVSDSIVPGTTSWDFRTKNIINGVDIGRATSGFPALIGLDGNRLRLQ